MFGESQDLARLPRDLVLYLARQECGMKNCRRSFGSRSVSSPVTKLGEVKVNMGKTSCKVPDALGYIEKVEAMGRLGRKKKEARC